MRGGQFQSHENRRVRGQSECCQILASQVQFDGLLQVLCDLVERGPLGDDWDLETLCYIAGLLPGPDHSLDRSLKHLCLLWIALPDHWADEGRPDAFYRFRLRKCKRSRFSSLYA